LIEKYKPLSSAGEAFHLLFSELQYSRRPFKIVSPRLNTSSTRNPSNMATGSCLCGAIAYSYTGAPQVTALCHCTDCQKWSGGAYTSNVVVRRSDFKVTKGSPKNYNVKGDSGKMNDHWFCGGMFFSYSIPPHPVLVCS